MHSFLSLIVVDKSFGNKNKNKTRWEPHLNVLTILSLHCFRPKMVQKIYIFTWMVFFSFGANESQRIAIQSVRFHEHKKECYVYRTGRLSFFSCPHLAIHRNFSVVHHQQNALCLQFTTQYHNFSRFNRVFSVIRLQIIHSMGFKQSCLCYFYLSSEWLNPLQSRHFFD